MNLVIISKWGSGLETFVNHIKDYDRSYNYIRSINHSHSMFLNYRSITKTHKNLINIELGFANEDIYKDLLCLNDMLDGKEYKIIIWYTSILQNSCTFKRTSELNIDKHLTEEELSRFSLIDSKMKFLIENMKNVLVVNGDEFLESDTNKSIIIENILQGNPTVKCNLDSCLQKDNAFFTTLGEKGINCISNEIIKNINFFLLFFGSPSNCHKIIIKSWAFTNYDFYIFTNKPNEWKEICDSYRNIYVKESNYDTITSKLLTLGFDSSDCEHIFGKNKNFHRLCILKPLYNSLFKEYVEDKKCDYWGWIDHDTILSKMNLNNFNGVDSCYLFKAPFFVTREENTNRWKSTIKFNFVELVKSRMGIDGYDEAHYIKLYKNKYSLLSFLNYREINKSFCFEYDERGCVYINNIPVEVAVLDSLFKTKDNINININENVNIIVEDNRIQNDN